MSLLFTILAFTSKNSTKVILKTSKNSTKVILKNLLCAVSIVREKLLLQRFSFMDFGDVTEAYTYHVSYTWKQSKTVKTSKSKLKLFTQDFCVKIVQLESQKYSLGDGIQCKVQNNRYRIAECDAILTKC